MSDTDLQLLMRYARQNAEEAFAELVHRHLNLVFSAALRQVRSPQLAEEVAQSVFIDLACQAQQLAPDTILTAWLYRVTRRTAIDVVRREARRQLRERVSIELTAMNATVADWMEIEPLLDEAMHTLDETDRTAVLLRYFDNKSLREIGQTLDVTDEAARKRISRAIERLYSFFSKRGVTVGLSGVVVAISAHAVQSAPPGLATAISAAAVLAGSAVTSSTVIAATKPFAMTTLQKALITTTIAAALGAGVYEARQASTLRDRVGVFKQRQAPLLAQIQQLERERNEATNRLALLTGQISDLERSSSELLSLRGEITRLRRESQEAAQAKVTASKAGNDPSLPSAESEPERLNQLIAWLQRNPSEKTPELGLIPAHDWLKAAKADLDSEDTNKYLLAVSAVRGTAELTVVAPVLFGALKHYALANDGQFPTDLSQLKPYFRSPIDDAILQRYEILSASSLSQTVLGDASLGSEWVITQKAPVNAFDARMVIGLSNYFGSLDTNRWALAH